VGTDELEAVAEVQSPDADALVSGPGCYDGRVAGHVKARDGQTVPVQIQEKLEQQNAVHSFGKENFQAKKRENVSVVIR